MAGGKGRELWEDWEDWGAGAAPAVVECVRNARKRHDTTMKQMITKGLQWLLVMAASGLAWAAAAGWIGEGERAALVEALGQIVEPLAAALAGAAMFALTVIGGWLAKAVFRSKGGPPAAYLVMLAAWACIAFAAALQVGCAGLPVRFTGDGCALVGREISTDGTEGTYTVWVGGCQDKRLVAEWGAPDGTQVRGVRWPAGDVEILYRTSAGWVEWDSKSGVQVGPVQAALDAGAGNSTAGE